MADNNIFNSKDSMDITELASLNDDISPELIEQLQQKIQQNALEFSGKTSDIKNSEVNSFNDEDLFEDASVTQDKSIKNENENLTENEESKDEKNHHATLNQNFDDNFLKKYKAKLSKQKNDQDSSETEKPTIANEVFQAEESKDIEQVTNGNITEKSISQEQKNYNDSLDFLDGNVKYSKYVIYIDPQNVDFIENLTVKERKNLINKILREQDDIAITKQRFKIIQTIIRHAIVAILTIAVSIPIIYITINASLEATINNYRRSQSIFQTLYRENGKITQYKKY